MQICTKLRELVSTTALTFAHLQHTKEISTTVRNCWPAVKKCFKYYLASGWVTLDDASRMGAIKWCRYVGAYWAISVTLHGFIYYFDRISEGYACAHVAGVPVTTMCIHAKCPLDSFVNVSLFTFITITEQYSRADCRADIVALLCQGFAIPAYTYTVPSTVTGTQLQPNLHQ